MLREGVVNTKAAETCTVVGVSKRTVIFQPVQDLKNVTDFRFFTLLSSISNNDCSALTLTRFLAAQRSEARQML